MRAPNAPAPRARARARAAPVVNPRPGPGPPARAPVIDPARRPRRRLGRRREVAARALDLIDMKVRRWALAAAIAQYNAVNTGEVRAARRAHGRATHRHAPHGTTTLYTAAHNTAALQRVIIAAHPPLRGPLGWDNSQQANRFHR
jgi:hypothetical protein